MDTRTLRAVVRGALPPGLLEISRPAGDAAERMRHRGDAVSCPLCGSSFSGFSTFNNRSNARCPQCGSLERHRLLWLYLDRETDLFSRPQTVLHVAPERYLRERLAAVHGDGYVYGDLGDPEPRLDVTALPFPDDSFDVAICSHVFEHVPDDGAATREFARVLTPSSWGVLDAPVDAQRERTYEDWSITSPGARRAAFGQWDHVRVYGRDYTAMLRGNGFTVGFGGTDLADGEAARFGLRPQ